MASLHQSLRRLVRELPANGQTSPRRDAAAAGRRSVIGCYRYCNHCGTDIQSASAWVHNAVTIAKSFGHRDDIWLREATGRERELIGESIYAHIRDAAALRDSRSILSPTRVL